MRGQSRWRPGWDRGGCGGREVQSEAGALLGERRLFRSHKADESGDLSPEGPGGSREQPTPPAVQPKARVWDLVAGLAFTSSQSGVPGPAEPHHRERCKFSGVAPGPSHPAPESPQTQLQKGPQQPPGD